MAREPVLFLCTGNASRSVMAGSALSQRRPDLTIITAGTLVIDGLPLSVRTRKALDVTGLSSAVHRSQQAKPEHLQSARLVIGMAPEHVMWVRRNHPDAAERTMTLIHLARGLVDRDNTVEEWIGSADLASHTPGEDEEIVDPGGGEVDGYIAVASQIIALIEQVAARL